MNKYKQNKQSKAIPQKGDIIDIRHLLPRGTMAKIAVKHNQTNQNIQYIASGKVNNPHIYKELLQIAEDYTAERQLIQENKKKAEELCQR